MKKRKLMWNVLKRTGANKLLYGYLISFIIIAVLIVIVEPDINSIQDGIWYCFSVMTTIGFGDLIAVTLIGRILSIVLSVYSIIMIAVIPGLITSFYLEVVKLRANDSMEKFMSDLERLPELSKEELTVLSEKVKNFQKKKK